MVWKLKENKGIERPHTSIVTYTELTAPYTLQDLFFQAACKRQPYQTYLAACIPRDLSGLIHGDLFYFLPIHCVAYKGVCTVILSDFLFFKLN